MNEVSCSSSKQFLIMPLSELSLGSFAVIIESNVPLWRGKIVMAIRVGAVAAVGLNGSCYVHDKTTKVRLLSPDEVITIKPNINTFEEGEY